jgi:hypothetical protein
MTKDEIMEMAKMAQLPHDFETGNPLWLDKLEIFARLVAGKEREDCAKICDERQFMDGERLSFKIRARV